MADIITSVTKNDFDAAGSLFREYAAWLKIDLCFQGFEAELQQLEQMYAQPKGVILLAKEKEHYIGCVAVREKEAGVAELKRMWIQPGHQGQGLGSVLLEKALSFAKDAGYEKIRLDTLATMKPAIALYKRFGFYTIDPYYFNPEKTAVFFEKLL